MPKSSGWGVAVYEVDRVYGGPEEGGWYYTTGELVFSDSNEDWTEEFVTREAILLAEGKYARRQSSSSVNYRGGDYSVRVTEPGEEFPEFFPEEPPTYS